MYYFRFAYPQVFYLFVPLLIAAIVYRIKFHRYPTYQYPLTNQIKKSGLTKNKSYKTVLLLLRSMTLLFLIVLIARPQWTDARSKITVDGVDIMLALDVSGSMQLFDDLQDRRQRIAIAKKEAINFVKKRPEDQIGIVIFGAEAIARCPLTLDKEILIKIIDNTNLGIISPSGTSLATGLATTITKLKNSKAKNKIIILLTDGQPTPETESVSIETALELAKKFQTKIYTVAIGNKRGGYGQNSFGFVQQIPDSVNELLLQNIAQQTGGKFFRANNPKEMRAIYNTINKLEKTQYETSLFSRHYEAFASFIWFFLFLLCFELLFRLFIWRELV
ncbi:VWA domain-containing protein [Candidatus Dependentiae bacterium]|nr:VWA domain-containing protein [Candidatus Dependentiae bacterium]